MKKILTLLLTLCVLSSSVVSISAMEFPYTEIEKVQYEDNVNELSPRVASECIVYVEKHINMDGNEPDATYIYQGSGGSIIYSMAQTNSLGQVIWRKDLASYNGMPLHHGSINGPHIHYYTWNLFEGIWRYIESGVEALG